MSDLLEYRVLEEVMDRAIKAELWEPDKRRLLFFRMADLRGRVPRAAADEGQLRTDLMFLNPTAPREGVHPLLIWLQNARPLVAGTDQQDFFERLVSRLGGEAAGAVVSPAVVRAVENEAILFEDDMLPVGYLEAGRAAGRAVARLLVPRYDDGQPHKSKRYWGTGWLLADSLLITNHHVFSARDDGEGAAGGVDLRVQALATIVQFDIDSDGAASEPTPVRDLLESDADLDFAIARIDRLTDRSPLPVDRAPLAIRNGEVVPLNIIQHPGGSPKKIAIRNNLATAANHSELRYFTSTLGGSSGAPVLDDKWRVVGIHRGSIGTKVLNFQGRTSAVINLGTQISAILEKLPAALRAEIR